MTLTDCVFIISLGIVWWSYSGYFLYLSRFRAQPTAAPGVRSLPGVSVIIPVYNEEILIEDKLKNLLETDYPKELLDVIVADGMSTDLTAAKVLDRAKSFPFIRLMQTNRKGKIPQINVALKGAKHGIIISTDVDGMLEKGTIRAIVEAITSDGIAVAGALVTTSDRSEKERNFWRMQNAIRLLETRKWMPFSVIAVCYGYKKDMFGGFPEDVIADDVYLPFLANTMGLKSAYLNNARAYETRSAASFPDMFRHKSRKSNADLRELFRFFERIPEMPAGWRTVYLTKFLQMAVAPFFVFLLVASVAYELVSGRFLLVGLCGALLLASAYVSNRRLFGEDLGKVGGTGVAGTAWTFLLTCAILVSAVIRYPFFRQTSSYEKLNVDNGAAR